MKYVVISYDISDDKKRNKVANMLLDYGTRVQYSVFECLIDAKTLEKLVERLKPLPEKNDSIRIYQICGTCLKKVVMLGKAVLTKVASFHIV